MCSGTCGLWPSAPALNHVRQERCIDVPLSRTWTLDLTPTDANATKRMRNRHISNWAKLASQAWPRPRKRFQAIRVGPACRRPGGPGGGHQGASQNTQGWNLPNVFLRHIISRQILECGSRRWLATTILSRDPYPYRGGGRAGTKLTCRIPFFFAWKPWDSDPTPQMEL